LPRARFRSSLTYRSYSREQPGEFLGDGPGYPRKLLESRSMGPQQKMSDRWSAVSVGCIGLGSLITGLGVGAGLTMIWLGRQRYPRVVDMSGDNGSTSASYEGLPPSIDSFTPVPGALVDFIAENLWKVLEVSAGGGSNAKRLRDKGIDTVAFDMIEADGVRYGINGTFEEKFPDRALLACSAYDAEKSVKRFTGKVVILGGNLFEVTAEESNYDIVGDVSQLNVVEPVKALEIKHCKKEAYGDLTYAIGMRPDYQWMVGNGWTLEESFIGKGNGGAREPLRIFQVWVANN